MLGVFATEAQSSLPYFRSELLQGGNSMKMQIQSPEEVKEPIAF